MLYRQKLNHDLVLARSMSFKVKKQTKVSVFTTAEETGEYTLLVTFKGDLTLIIIKVKLQ